MVENRETTSETIIVRQISKRDRVLVMLITLAAALAGFRSGIASLNSWRGDQSAMGGDTSAAIFSYRKALLLEPDQLQALTGLAHQYFLVKRRADSEAQLKKILRLESNNRFAHMYLGILYFQRRSYRSALPHLEAGSKGRSDYALSSLRLLARCYEKLGRSQSAIETLRRIQKRFPASAAEMPSEIARLRAMPGKQGK